MNRGMFPLLVGTVSFAIPSWAAERHMMQSLVPATSGLKPADSRAPGRNLRRSSSRVRCSMTGRVLASTDMGKTGRQWAAVCPTEALAS
jgi:hypothetical protein